MAGVIADDAERTRRRFVVVLGVASVFMIPWIVTLAVTLPPRYLAGHWRATWVGFDVALGAALAFTAWAALRRRQIVVPSALISGTLLACDAWFDIMTASGPDQWVSLTTAVVVELPLAGWLFFVAFHLLHLTIRRGRELAGQPTDVSLWRLPLLGVAPRKPRTKR